MCRAKTENISDTASCKVMFVVLQLCKEMNAVLDHVSTREEQCTSDDSQQSILEPSSREQRRSSSDFSSMAAQIVFSLLDHLRKWLRQRKTYLAVKESRNKSSGSSSGSSQLSKSDVMCARISDFLDKIPQESLARASAACGAFTRALLHYELFLRGKKSGIQTKVKLESENFEFLQVKAKIYTLKNDCA